jgi:hypothetical protein
MAVIVIINKGLKQYFQSLSRDVDSTKFLTKLINLVLLLGALSAAIQPSYYTNEKHDWLTLSWAVADQLEEVLGKLFIALIIFTVMFVVLHVAARRKNE